MSKTPIFQTSPDVLPVEKGGTGAATAAAAREALGVPASSHKHSAADITSGTLPLARGGTGATTAAAARSALGAAAGYRYTCTITASGWANNSGGGKYQDITVSVMTAAMTPNVGIVQTNDVAASELMVAQFSANIRRIETLAGKIRVYTYSGGSTPSVNIPIQLTGTV